MKKITLFVFGLLISLSVKSQELEFILLASDDASVLMEKYMSTAVEGMLSGLNNGWYHTAKPHKKFGFDISILANAAMVSSSSETFQFDASDYKYLSLESGSSVINTIMGSENNSEIGIRIPEANNYKIASFTMPDGIGSELPLNAVPSPMIQGSIGLFLNTDLSIRYLPEIKTDDVEGNLIGFGIKHDLMQYFGPLEKLPLNVSIFAGFSSMNATYFIDEINGLEGENQQATFDLKAYTVQAIGSLDFPVITVYGGIGYDKGTSNLQLNGSYVLEYTIEATNTTISETVVDPVNMDFDTSGARATLGARLNIGFFKIFGDYSVKEYNTITAGIAFSFR